MTGGRAVILGPTGRNFAAGMSGGIAYVYCDDLEQLRVNCNLELVDPIPLGEVDDPEFVVELKEMIEKHHIYTGSTVAKAILEDWDTESSKFVQVMPRDYKRALEDLEAEALADAAGEAVPELAEAR
jgi:glutamate synthase (NADPH/NADH) large chain